MQQLICPVRSQEEGGIGPSPDLECRLSFAFHCRIESAKICKILNCPKIKYRIIILQLRFDILICGRNVESAIVVTMIGHLRGAEWGGMSSIVQR